MRVSDDDKIADKLLLLKLKEGNRAAFDTLYEKYWHGVYAVAFKRLQNPDRAKDITQDVFLQLWLKREDNCINNLSAYLFTIARNMVFIWMQRERRYTPIPQLLLKLTTAHDQTDAGILRKEFMMAYEALLSSLTLSQQQIFRMRYQQDLSTSQIAEQLEISRKTVQNQLGKAVNQLRSSLTLILLLSILSNR